jgi:hypothetical protein
VDVTEELSPEEWGLREARKAPRWTAEDRRRVAGILGLKIKPITEKEELLVQRSSEAA